MSRRSKSSRSRKSGRRTVSRNAPTIEPGAPPGMLEAPPGARPTSLKVMVYSPDHFEEHPESSLDLLETPRPEGAVLWLDIVGLGTLDVLQSIAERFAIHPLAMEDVVHLHQRPKIEDYPSSELGSASLYMALWLPQHTPELRGEQISLILVPGAVLTFREHAGDWFEPVRQRLRKGRGRIRRKGADYLAYALLDAVVDHAFPVLSRYQGQMARIEEEILDKLGSSQSVVELAELKKELMQLHQLLQPLRDSLRRFLQDDTVEGFAPETLLYLRDCQDHLGQALDLVDFYRDQGTNLVNLHLAMASQNMNEVMKVLTIISTVFIPLSFIAGLYGMNFDTQRSPYNMPELSWTYGYPLVLIFMTNAIAVIK
ncbi:MAG: magnesium/cobalt transporter CorA, partial [Myxococcota bacterium]